MGRGGGHKRGATSADTKAKISAALKGKRHPHRGHPVSAATRDKLSKALKGKRHPHRGHPVSAVTRQKIADALRRRAVLGGRKPRTKTPSSRRRLIAGVFRKSRLKHGGDGLVHVGVRHTRRALIHVKRQRQHRVPVRRRIVAHRVSTERS